MRTSGMKAFTKAASSSYSTLLEPDKEMLRVRCSERSQPLTAKDIKQKGCKIFKSIEKQVNTELSVMLYTHIDVIVPMLLYMPMPPHMYWSQGSNDATCIGPRAPMMPHVLVPGLQ